MTAALLAALLIGQGLSGQAIDSAQVGRVRKAVAENLSVQTVRAQPPRPLSSDVTAVPPYAALGYPLHHYGFLQQVTPEAFRASTLYPGAKGPEITPLLKALFTASSPEMQRRRESSARKEVQQALENPGRRAPAK
jgi:hypothetical protein